MVFLNKKNKVICSEKIICRVPPEILKAAKNLNQNIEEMVEMALIIWEDGTKEILCPYYNENSLSEPKEYGCYPPINLLKKIEEDPEKMQKMLSLQLGCKCQYDKCKF